MLSREAIDQVPFTFFTSLQLKIAISCHIINIYQAVSLKLYHMADKSGP